MLFYWKNIFVQYFLSTKWFHRLTVRVLMLLDSLHNEQHLKLNKQTYLMFKHLNRKQKVLNVYGLGFDHF